MNNLPFSSMIIVALLVLTALIYLIIYRRHAEAKRPPRYKVLFIIGASWIPLGLGTDNKAFWIVGAVLMAIGLLNKSKWKEEPNWADLTPSEKKLKISLIFGLAVLLVLGVAFYFIR